MLTLLIGTDWTENRKEILRLIAQDVSKQKGGRILMVPELISHDTERRLCAAAGDTCSRYAEVLSFTRLANRVADTVGHAAEECLDNGGRVVAMASAARQLHSKLKAYASVETRPEFLTALVDAVDEFKRCCITSGDLMEASKCTQGSLAQKLEELSLLLESYDSLCARGKRDPRDQMTWLLEQLEVGTFAQEHVFYIDGFPDFTRQHIKILMYLIEASENVTVSLTCDRPGSGRVAFEKAGETALQLLQYAQNSGIKANIVHVASRRDSLSPLRESLFQGHIAQTIPQDYLKVYRTETVYQECAAAVERIFKLVHDGARYRDIRVVCSDMTLYGNTVESTFKRSNIPLYVSGTEEVLEQSVVTTVLSAMDAVLGGFDQQDMLRYLKSVLSPLDLETCDTVENYAIMWGINGKGWLQEWSNHPNGLGQQWNDAAYERLQRLNDARKLAIVPLAQFHKEFHEADKVSQQVLALYHFFEEISLGSRLSMLASQLDTQGDNRSAQILNQLWDILLTALEQLYDVLGETVWDAENFVRLFKLLLSQYDVGTIPSVLDAVSVGPVSAMRCQQSKHLIVLGALEGSLPGYCGSTGVLTDQERVALRQMGVPLTGGAMEGLQAEFAEIYGVFCGTEESVTVSCPGGQPSFLYRRLCQLKQGESTADYSIGTALGSKEDAGAYLVRCGAENAAKELNIHDIYTEMQAKAEHTLGRVTKENIQKIYGEKLNLSASQIDKQADCRLSYFLKYGLRAKERKPITVDPAEFGTYVHAVLEETAKEITQLGGFHNIPLNQVLAVAKKHSQAYAAERFSQIDSQRLTYLFNRNSAELELIVHELWDELRKSEFLPTGFEVAFGEQGEVPPINVSGRAMPAQLCGFVDRVDLWKTEGKSYFRVVDYKTGKKDFDYCDIFNGFGLQMLLYLFALEQEGQRVLGDSPIPAGVQYFPARVPFVSSDGIMTDEEADAARQKLWKRRGLLLSQEHVLNAMESSDEPKRLPIARKKDGTLSGDLADQKQFALLRTYVFALVGKMVDDIASGCVDANPYTRGGSHNACAYCPYKAVCHEQAVEGRRDYKAITAQQFWDGVQKELSKHG